MSRIGLYYPFIHFRDEAWLKLAALYWSSMGRIVPHGYDLGDSRVVRQLSDELGFVREFDPARAASRIAPMFAQLLLNHGSELRKRYGPSPHFDADYPAVWEERAESDRVHLHMQPPSTWFSPIGRRARHPDLAYVAIAKVEPRLVEALLGTGLVVRQSKYGEQRWRGGQWLGMHPRLAAIYMTALAEDLAAANQLQPVTDSTVDHVAVAGWTMPRLAQALLGEPPLSQVSWRRSMLLLSAEEVPDLLGTLAIRSVIPKNLAAVPIEKVIEIRRHYHEELVTFRAHLEEIAASLGSAETIEDPRALQAHLEAAYQEKLGPVLNRLQNDLKTFGIDTVMAAVNVRVALPIAATSLAELAHVPLPGSPVVAAGGAIAFSLAEVLRTKRHQAAEHVRSSPAAYLLHLQEGLQPATLLERIQRVIRKFLTGF